MWPPFWNGTKFELFLYIIMIFYNAYILAKFRKVLFGWVPRNPLLGTNGSESTLVTLKVLINEEEM